MTDILTFLLGSLWGIALVAWASQVDLPEWTGRIGRALKW